MEMFHHLKSNSPLNLTFISDPGCLSSPPPSLLNSVHGPPRLSSDVSLTPVLSNGMQFHSACFLQICCLFMEFPVTGMDPECWHF